MSSTMMMPPLIPKVDAILVLDGDGHRLAGKYYGGFLKEGITANNSNSSSNNNTNNSGKKSSSAPAVGASEAAALEEVRSQFERQVFAKISGMVARPEAAEVVTCQGKTVVFCGGAAPGATGHDVRVVHVGSSAAESELLLAHCCEGMYDALQQLMGGSTDRSMVLDNLELVFLLIDEHCDGGMILEVDGRRLAAAVLLRDDDATAKEPIAAAGPVVATPGLPAGVMSGDMTLTQAFRHARDQFIAGMTSRDGM